MAKSGNTPPSSLEPGALSGPLGAWFKRPLAPWSAHAFTVADLSRLRIEGEAHEADAGSIVLEAPVTIEADGYPGRSWKGRVEEIPDSVTLRRLKPQDPSRPTDARVLAVKVAFAEPLPLKLGTTVDLRIARAAR